VEELRSSKNTYENGQDVKLEADFSQRSTMVQFLADRSSKKSVASIICPLVYSACIKTASCTHASEA
jgi:hypothetical protein